MLFNSFHFIVFFPLVAFLYFVLPHRFRWVLLLGASYYFYASWKVEYLILILISTLIDYVMALCMGARPTRRQRRPYLLMTIVVNIGILFAFKYANFVGDSAQMLTRQFNVLYNFPSLNVLLPVGISFYTFQTLGYSIDVYRGKKKPERHLGIFALYVSFFPQLVAGPIERAGRLLPQFYRRHAFDYQRVVSGLQRICWGFFKKVVIADQAALYVDRVYGNPENYPGQILILATYLFAYQVYCDFSGYSDIAIGAARVMGFDLMENFNRPFSACSIQEFWQRWHISLSTWFRDYVYIPLGGNHVSKGRWYFNLFLVFLLAGLWHGAGWNFIIWGGLHGIYLIISFVTADLRDNVWGTIHRKAASFPLIDTRRLRQLIAVFCTFHLFVFSLMIFRAGPLNRVVFFLTEAFDLDFSILGLTLALDGRRLLVVFFAILFMEAVQFWENRQDLARVFMGYSDWLRWSAYYLSILAILLFGEFGGREFFYFQF